MIHLTKCSLDLDDDYPTVVAIRRKLYDEELKPGASLCIGDVEYKVTDHWSGEFINIPFSMADGLVPNYTKLLELACKTYGELFNEFEKVDVIQLEAL